MNKPLEIFFALHRAEIAALRLEAQDVVAPAGTDDLRRELQELHKTAIGELQIEIVVGQNHAIANIVEHELHDFAGLLDTALGNLDFGLRRLNSTFALLEVGDVTGGSDHADRPTITATGDKTVLPDPPP